nr:MAG TPA: hypothetical protein [Caudoviricetes sp.]
MIQTFLHGVVKSFILKHYDASVLYHSVQDCALNLESF